VVTDANEKAFMEPLTKWDGAYTPESIAATLFTQLMYELAKGAFADELGPVQFDNLLRTRALDHALPLLVADANSPWWDDVSTPAKENRFEIVRIAWSNTIKHLQGLYGTSLLDWTWGKTHTLTHNHPLGRQKPLNYVFDVGPFSVPGGRETPNNFAYSLGPAPWAVTYGPSTRRVIDFADAAQAVGINPLGQSGVWPDRHYSDQASAYVAGEYLPMWLDSKDVLAHTRSTLTLRPAR
jgi:penicillin amidase